MSLYDKDHNSNIVRKEFITQKGYLKVQKWTDPVAADADRLLDDQATSNSVVTTVSSFLAQPDFPRNITITPGGTTASVPGADVTVTGTNIRDEVITEAITIAENASSIVSGVKAFKTVTEIVFPIQDGAGATYDVGVGDVLGLDRLMNYDGVLKATIDGVHESTRPTVTFDADEIEKNTIDTNTALNASRDVVVLYVTEEVSNDMFPTTA